MVGAASVRFITSERSERVEREASCSAGAYHECGRRIPHPRGESISSVVALHHIVARKRNTNFAVLKVTAALALGAAANDTGAEAGAIGLVDSHYEISADLTWSARDHTAGEGPIEVGLSTNDLSITEIIESLDSNPTGRGDVIALERSRRPVREVGQFAGALTEETLNDGQPIRTKLGFRMSDSTTLNLYAVNRSGATLTTGTVITVTGKLYVRWA